MKANLKTVREWLEELPEPYRKKAIANAREDMLNVKVKDILWALIYAFYWRKSPEGVIYWRNVYNLLELKLTNPKKNKNKIIAEKVVNFADVANDYLNGKLEDKKFKKLLKKFKNELK